MKVELKDVRAHNRGWAYYRNLGCICQKNSVNIRIWNLCDYVSTYYTISKRAFFIALLNFGCALFWIVVINHDCMKCKKPGTYFHNLRLVTGIFLMHPFKICTWPERHLQTFIKCTYFYPDQCVNSRYSRVATNAKEDDNVWGSTPISSFGPKKK